MGALQAFVVLSPSERRQASSIQIYLVARSYAMIHYSSFFRGCDWTHLVTELLCGSSLIISSLAALDEKASFCLSQVSCIPPVASSGTASSQMKSSARS